MARGGYRKPSNPAPVSGPGALSRRTDGGPGSKQKIQEIRTGQYGESKALLEQQQGAPMAGNPMPNPKVQTPAGGQKVQPLFAPTSRPEEPVTAGLPFGPGTNESTQTIALPSGPAINGSELANALAPLLPYDRTGNIRAMYDLAVSRGW